jgi:hypothetical protein
MQGVNHPTPEDDARGLMLVAAGILSIIGILVALGIWKVIEILSTVLGGR